jgi:hypothetical protein
MMFSVIESKPVVDVLMIALKDRVADGHSGRMVDAARHSTHGAGARRS